MRESGNKEADDAQGKEDNNHPCDSNADALPVNNVLYIECEVQIRPIPSTDVRCRSVRLGRYATIKPFARFKAINSGSYCVFSDVSGVLCPYAFRMSFTWIRFGNRCSYPLSTAWLHWQSASFGCRPNGVILSSAARRLRNSVETTT
jgi:hypothetical protein